jgi:hypothetical protein
VRGGGDREHPGEGQARDEDDQPVTETGHERVAAGETGEVGVGPADLSERLLLAPIRDQLGRASQQLDESGGEVSTDGGLPPADVPSQAPGDRGNENAAENEPEREHEPCEREDRGGHTHAESADGERHQRRAEASEEQALQGVDVADHPAKEIAPAVRVELGRREGLDAPVEAGTDPPQ